MKATNLILSLLGQEKSALSKLLTVALTMGLAAPALGAEITKFDDGTTEVNVAEVCGSWSASCSKQLDLLKVTRTQKKVTANAPISKVEICGTGRKPTKLSERNGIHYIDDYNTSYGTCNTFTVNQRNSFEVSSSYDFTYYIQSVTVKTGSIKPSSDLQFATGSMQLFYTYSLEQLTNFENNMKKSDRRHVIRLKSALEGALKNMTDKKGNTLPVTHVKVQEDARMIMVFATVLNELIEDYGDVPALQGPTAALKNLSQEIRLSYGWSEGLSGSASKSLVALSEVIDLELRELYAAAAAFNQANPGAFNGLMRANIALNSAARAQNGGDAAVKAQVSALAAKWNSPEWQQTLNNLLDAPQDYARFVQPKLRLLIMAAESVNDLTNEQLNIDSKISSKLK